MSNTTTICLIVTIICLFFSTMFLVVASNPYPLLAFILSFGLSFGLNYKWQ